ncbi:MAG TPA: DUF5693 family protein [Limnochordales bacterium]
MRGAAGRRPGRAAWWAGGLALAVGLAGAAWALLPRARLERADRGPVELTMDWASLEEAGRGAWGREPADVLRQLAEAGLTSVAVTEQTVQTLVDAGRGVVLTDRQAAVLGVAVPGPGTWLLRPGAPPLPLPEPPPAALSLGVGLPEEALQAARQAGLPVLLRYGDRRRVVPWLLDEPAPGPGAAGPDAAQAPATSRVVIFEGTSVPDPAQAAQAMSPAGRAVGLVEFAQQRGADRLARELGLAAVAVHSMKPEEMAAATVPEAVARYLRAVRERGVRLLYLRPAATPEETVQLVAELSAALRREGLATGLSAPAPVLPAPPPAALLLVGLGAGGLAAWAWAAWAGRREGARPGPGAALALLVGLAGGAVVAWARSRGWEGPASVLLRQAGALAVALVAPVAATGAAAAAAGEAGPGFGRRAAGAAAAFVAVSAAGGVLVAALLSDSLFMLRLEQFRGVKLAHALPLLAVAAAALAASEEGLARVARWAGRPIRWGDAVLALALLAAGAYYLVRTGNEAGAVSALERMARGWLEQALAVRPRTKEFMVAYPALAVALYGQGRGWWRRWPAAHAAVMAAAAIGPVSIVNSFAHIHTPLAVTGVRVLNGLALGLVTGALAWAACELLRRAGVPLEGAERDEGRPVGVLRIRQPGR